MDPKPLDQCRLYTFLDTSYLKERSPEEVTRQLCDGGSDLIQLRAKELPNDSIRRIAESIFPITEAAEVGLVINDRPEIALEIGAFACHLGQEDFFDAGSSHSSDLIPSDRSLKLGLSSHAPEQAERAVAAGADYIAIGPVYATPTKPASDPVTLDYVRWAAHNVSIPWFAIGGINLENVDAVISAGALRVCVVSAILNAPDIALACQNFKNRLLSVRN